MAKGPDSIKMIYPTNRGNPQTWYFQGEQDARMKIQAAKGVWSKNVDGSFSLSQNKDVYLAIETNDKSGFMGTNQLTGKARGFMRNIRDWKNIEAHSYFYVEEGNDPASNGSITITCHGGDPYATVRNTCVGIGYHFTVYRNGSTRFGKCLWYPNGFLYTTPKNLLSDLTGRWIGIKLVCIVKGPNKVKLEVFVDEGNMTNNWVPLDTITDTGGWGGQGLSLDAELAIKNVCGGTSDQVLDMGGPVVSFAWKDFGDVAGSGLRVKNMAIREVDPKFSYNEPPIQKLSGLGSLKPKFGTQPQTDTNIYPDSFNFATTDRAGI